MIHQILLDWILHFLCHKFASWKHIFVKLYLKTLEILAGPHHAIPKKGDQIPIMGNKLKMENKNPVWDKKMGDQMKKNYVLSMGTVFGGTFPKVRKKMTILWMFITHNGEQDACAEKKDHVCICEFR